MAARRRAPLLREVFTRGGLRYLTGSIIAGLGFLGILTGTSLAVFSALELVGALLGWAAATFGSGIAAVLLGAWLRKDTPEEARAAIGKALRLPVELFARGAERD